MEFTTNTKNSDNLTNLEIYSNFGEELKNIIIILLLMIIIIIPFPKSTTSTNIHIHHFQTTFMCPRSIAGVTFDLVTRFRLSLLLYTASGYS